MIARTLLSAGLAVTLVASFTPGAGLPAAAAAAAAPTSSSTSAAPGQSTGEVMVPGGIRFVSNAAGLRLVSLQGDAARSDFLNELAAFLSAPLVLALVLLSLSVLESF